MHLIKRHSFLIIAILILIGGYILLSSDEAVAPNGQTELSNQDLVDYAKSDFDKKAMMNQDIMIGRHNDTTVRVNFPCSDVCPENTTRIIYYDVDASLSEMCEMAGGKVKSILIPVGIGVVPQTFCFPNPIIESGVYEFSEPQS